MVKCTIRCTVAATAIVFLSTALSAGSQPKTPVFAWDSASWKNPTRPTHSLITKLAIETLEADYPELSEYREQLIDGANVEIHELSIKCNKYGVDFNQRRKERYRGTNSGCERPDLIWEDSLDAYQNDKAKLAYFTLGVLLHQIQDMCVPAHAFEIYHQGNLTEFDNFEYMALWNWKPNVDDIEKEDPVFDNPWDYYEFAKAWCQEDAPNYKSRDDFSKTWTFADDDERRLLSIRQGAAIYVTMWALEAAVIAFHEVHPDD
jgi:hypothetical protein